MKRIVIACDGTWSRLDARHPTNVAKLAQAVLPVAPDGVAQVVCHLDGVGSGRGTGAAPLPTPSRWQTTCAAVRRHRPRRLGELGDIGARQSRLVPSQAMTIRFMGVALRIAARAGLGMRGGQLGNGTCREL